MSRRQPDPIDPARIVDLTGGTPRDILCVLDDLVAEGQGLAIDEVRALRDALAEALDATETTEEQEIDPSNADGVYLDVEGLAQVWTGLGHLIGVGEA